MNWGVLGRLRTGRPAGNSEHRFALTRWFAVVGALSIGFFSLGMGWLLSDFLASRMLERDAAISRDFVQSIANIQQVAGFFANAKGAPDPSVNEFFAHVAAMPDVIRANIYAPDRHVLWSSRPELIGQTFGANRELERALTGMVVIHREDEDEQEHGRGHEQTKAEHQGLDGHEAQFVENYLPVFEEPSHRLMAVIEVYRRPDALFAAIQSGQHLIRAGALGGGLFLFLILVWFVRRTERVLDEQQHRLVEAETLAAVGEMSAAVAHSIRNPLVSIRTSAELQCETGHDGQGVHAEIMRNVDRIEHLVRTLLSYAREPADRLARADLGQVLRDAAARFAPDLAARGRQLEVNLAPDLGTVVGDPLILAQVFNSLLANAAEATADGGQVRLIAQRQGRRARIDVHDTGAGIEAQHLPNIFKPFFTTKPRGMGLGLPLARRIAQRLGGSIDAGSEAGEGTVVTVYLPLAHLP
jgi:signal transduction histidine kinase